MDRFRPRTRASRRTRIAAALAGAALAHGATDRLLAVAQESPLTAPEPAESLYAADRIDQQAREREYDLVEVRFDVRIDEKEKTLEGRATNVIRPLYDGLAVAHFDAARPMEVRSVRIGATPATFRHEEDRLRVELGRAFGADETLAIEVEYATKSPPKGLYFVGPDETHPEKPWQVWTQGEDEDNRYWVPTYDYPNDRAAMEAFVTVREPLTVVSNGKLLGVESREEGWRTFHWKMDQPFVTYLLTLAIGDWERYADEWRGIPVEYYVQRGVGEETARRSFDETPAMLDFFSDWIGIPYPYAKYAQVAVTDFVVGGMENVSATTQTDRTLHDERAHLDTKSRGLVAHELAHQWFGDLLTCRDWSHLWLNEGFATYFEALYVEEVEGLELLLV